MVFSETARTSRGKFDYKQQADGSTPAAAAGCAVERAMRQHCRGQSSPGHHNKNRP